MNTSELLEKLRAALLVDRRDRAPLWSLIYLGFLFIPLGWQPAELRWLGPTVLSIPIFLLVYLRSYWRGAILRLLVIALLGFVLLPFNPCANTYLIFSVVVAPFVFRLYRHAIAYAVAILAGFGIECWILGISPNVFVLTAILCAASCVGSLFWRETFRKNDQLRISHEEIRRLAALAERERIGRDLHDLLGHTLSLIAIKAELAEKLAGRDADGAVREIADVKNIARDALKEVRVAVSGIRSAALEGEIAAARALLGSSGVELAAPHVETALPAEVETDVAMIVREAVTNIHLHSGARHAIIEIQRDAEAVLLVVRDDGKGGITRRGNGLTGIGERVRSLAGTLDIQSSPGEGTVVSARLPLPARS
jgi:two-component system, NarL family, sensor histidine kinase DesK